MLFRSSLPLPCMRGTAAHCRVVLSPKHETKGDRCDCLSRIKQPALQKKASLLLSPRGICPLIIKTRLPRKYFSYCSGAFLLFIFFLLQRHRTFTTTFQFSAIHPMSNFSYTTGFPIFCVGFTRDDDVVLAGGGGVSKCGVKNKIVRQHLLSSTPNKKKNLEKNLATATSNGVTLLSSCTTDEFQRSTSWRQTGRLVCLCTNDIHLEVLFDFCGL